MTSSHIAAFSRALAVPRCSAEAYTAMLRLVLMPPDSETNPLQIWGCELFFPFERKKLLFPTFFHPELFTVPFHFVRSFLLPFQRTVSLSCYDIKFLSCIVLSNLKSALFSVFILTYYGRMDQIRVTIPHSFLSGLRLNSLASFSAPGGSCLASNDRHSRAFISWKTLEIYWHICNQLLH